MIEHIDDVIYDSCLPDSSMTTTTLFTVSVGNTGNGITGKTYEHTNMESVGALSNNEKMTLYGVTSFVTPTFTDDTDVDTNTTFLNKIFTGYAEVFLASKSYNYYQLSMLNHSNVKYASPVASKIGIIFTPPLWKSKGFIPFNRPLVLASTNAIKVVVNWSAAVGASNPFYLYVAFVGIRTRNVS
jgi:hypothetical protein